MELRQKLILGYSCLIVFLFKQKKPIFVSWSITEQCNLQCKYCHVWRKSEPLELPTHLVLGIINTLSKMGTKMMRLTGGEPLARDDITQIINHAHALGIYTVLSTNGILFSEKIKEINKLDRVSISLEGPESIHDSIRGGGSYKKAVEAIEIAKRKNIPVSIATTLNALNLDSMDYLLRLGERFNAKVVFQPAIQTCLYSQEENPLSPDITQYRKAILKLVRLKNTNKFIGNSMAGLRHLYHWPVRTDINCVAGKIICRLDCKGRMKPCGRFDIKNNTLDVVEKGVEKCFDQLDHPSCGYCWCSSFVELNLFSKFNLSVLINLIKA